MKINGEISSCRSDLTPENTTSINLLRAIIRENLPEGFEEIFSNKGIGYVVPHSLYPPGYHCNPRLALPFISLAAQKKFVALHHMGLYADPELLAWFTESYAKHSSYQMDMGKSCIRFKTAAHIPQALVADLCRKVSPEAWIAQYEKQVKLRY